jgi:hypothetical protein
VLLLIVLFSLKIHHNKVPPRENKWAFALPVHVFGFRLSGEEIGGAVGGDTGIRRLSQVRTGGLVRIGPHISCDFGLLSSVVCLDKVLVWFGLLFWFGLVSSGV